MSVNPSDFQNFAETASMGASEFDWRNSVSRIYYGAYHLAQSVCEFCPDKNANFKMGSHERLSQRFKNHGSTNARSIAIVLECMKKHRHMADYEVDDPFDRNFPKEQLATYKVLQQKIASFRQENEKQSISK